MRFLILGCQTSIVHKFNAAWAPAYTLVDIFVSGTSGIQCSETLNKALIYNTAGIGLGIAEAFARHTKGNAHVVVVGRSSAAAAAILAGLPPASTAVSLAARLPRINLLVTTAGTINLESTITSEGLEVSTALWYYARAGQGIELDLSDLGLKKALKPVRDFDGFRTAGSQASTYIDLMFKDYAARNLGITFVHAHPGLVITPLLKHFSFTPEILATGKSIEAPAGASPTGQDGDDIRMDLPATEEVQRTLWEHTEEVIGGIE
ncbi:hypothetical protein C8R45DRAFT_1173693 [Mycena sanguinolenta]|nr:hypothetical protein C8R45DRAFT_1173693 [Mycena sanguinolenta]